MTPARRPIPLILVIDATSNGEAYSQAVRASGMHILVASNAEDGLKIATAARPDVVVFDLDVPSPDALDIAGRLKTGAAAAARVVVVCDRLPRGARKLAGRGDVDTFLARPCPPQVFLAELQRQLQPDEPGN